MYYMYKSLWECYLINCKLGLAKQQASITMPISQVGTERPSDLTKSAQTIPVSEDAKPLGVLLPDSSSFSIFKMNRFPMPFSL